MNWEKIFITILILEGIFFAILIVSLFIRRKYDAFMQKRLKRNEREISQVILACLQGKKEIDWRKELKKHSGSVLLIKVLEAFSHRFSGEDWISLQNEIATAYLIPQARMNWKNKFWFKRDQAARSFALNALPADEKKILSLMEDPVFLVRKSACLALIKLGTKEGIEKVIGAMSIEKGYASKYYQDLLLENENQDISKWIQEFASANKGRDFHLATLKLLGEKMQTLNYPKLHEDLASNDPEIRFSAVCVFTRNPQKGSEEFIFKCMEDPEDRIRKEAFAGASHFLSKICLEKLEKGLGDRSWEARKSAAFSLKKMGRAGQDILRNQKKENKEAFDVAQFALQFDE